MRIVVNRPAQYLRQPLVAHDRVQLEQWGIGV